MTERLGLGIVPGIGWRAREIETVAREAEDAGFEAIFNPEVNNDGLTTAQLMGAVTSRIKVGPWVSSIYLRHSYVCAQAAALIADATGERLILGLGVSHPLVNRSFGVGSTSPLEAMRHYVTEVQTWLRGEGPTTHLPQRPAPCPVPIHIAALTSKTVELAGEVADGVMPYLWSTERVAAAKPWIARGRANRRDARRSSCRLDCRCMWATISRPCANWHARISPSIAPSRTISACCGCRDSQQRRRKASRATRSERGASACSTLSV